MPRAKKLRGPNLHRATAERLLAGLLERARAVNASSSPFAARVCALYVFGSYLKGSERPNDLDVVVLLKNRYPHNSARQRAAEDARRSARKSEPRNVVDDIFWPQTEVLKFLKAGRGHLSVHEGRDLAFLRKQGEPVKLVFGSEHEVRA